MGAHRTQELGEVDRVDTSSSGDHHSVVPRLVVVGCTSVAAGNCWREVVGSLQGAGSTSWQVVRWRQLVEFAAYKP